MTTVPSVFVSQRAAVEPSGAGTHVLIVGVGEYPGLLGGDATKLVKDPMGLGQLSSPPESARAFADWFLKGQGDSSVGFSNPTAPLASLDMLISPNLAYRRHDGKEAALALPSYQNIAAAYERWVERVAANPHNIGVFYFCGHGATGTNDYLFPSDAGERNRNLWADAIDIATTARAARRRVSGALYFFIDACRQTARSGLNPGAGQSALEELDLTKPVACFARLVLWAAGEGQYAFGTKQDVSRFTAALIQALSAFSGEAARDSKGWVVTGDILARSVRTLLDESNATLPKEEQQYVEQHLIGSQPFHYERSQPRDVVGGTTWSANPQVRAWLATVLNSETVSAKAREVLAEQLEAQNLQIGRLQQEVDDWARRYGETKQRLAEESDSALAQQARVLLEEGRLDEAGEVLDRLIAAGKERLAAETRRQASYHLSRAQVFSLKFKSLEAIVHYEEAYCLTPDDPVCAFAYGYALLLQKDYRRSEEVYRGVLPRLRSLAKDNPAHLSNLAMTLNNLAVLYDETKQQRQAERMYGEALETFRALAKDNAAIHLPHVAGTLQNLGVLYGDTQRVQDAEDAYCEALEICRTSAKDNPAACLPKMAGTLHNLGALYANTQRLREAEDTYREALKIRRGLANDNPAAYLPDLAMTLNNLGLLYGNTERLAEAEGTLREALEICRRLAKDNPAAYLPDLAMTLNYCGLLFGTAQWLQEAEGAFREALEIRRALAKDKPMIYLPEVVATLHNLSVLYHLTKRPRDVENAHREMLELRRVLAKDSPTTYLPAVAETLNNLGALYGGAKRLQEAEGAFCEALEIRRPLARENPAAYLPDVAATLGNLGRLYSSMGRLREAKDAYREALEAYRALAKDDPAEYMEIAERILTELASLP